MLHVAWSNDRCAPEHMPCLGDYVFIDMPPEFKPVFARMRIPAFQDTEFYPKTPEQRTDQRLNRKQSRRGAVANRLACIKEAK